MRWRPRTHAGRPGTLQAHPSSDTLPAATLNGGRGARGARVPRGDTGLGIPAAHTSEAHQAASPSPWRLQQRPRKKLQLLQKLAWLRPWPWHLSQVQAERGERAALTAACTGQARRPAAPHHPGS